MLVTFSSGPTTSMRTTQVAQVWVAHGWTEGGRALIESATAPQSMCHISNISSLGPKCKSSPRESPSSGGGQTVYSLHQEPSPRPAAYTFLPWSPQSTYLSVAHMGGGVIKCWLFFFPCPPPLLSHTYFLPLPLPQAGHIS